MFGNRATFKERLLQIIQLFRQKDATNPDKALTIKELGLTQQFKELMKGKLGKSGIFVESNGKYYLSEDKLKEVQERISTERTIYGYSEEYGQRGIQKIYLLRVISAISVTVLLAIIIVNIFLQIFELKVLSFVLFIFLFFLYMIRIFYMVKLRKSLKEIRSKLTDFN